jgi:TIR domain
MIHKVFISYASKDAEVAKAVCKVLEAEDIRCWIAPRDILPGEEYADSIIEALNNCQLFLVILSEESNSSSQVRREVERAVSKNLSILTFRIDNTILSKAMEYYLSNRHWLDASNAVFSKQLHNLSEAVHKLLEHSPTPKDETNIPNPVEVIEPVKPLSQVKDETSAPAPHSKPARIRNKNGALWILAPVLVFILAAIAYFGLAGKGGLPFLGRITALITPSATHTIDYVVTMQSYDATSTAGAGDSWIQGFAEPILTQIASRPADFQDDFSDPAWSYRHWNFFNRVIPKNGQAMIATTSQWQGMGRTLPAGDFVARYTFTVTKTASQTVSLGFSFRINGTGETYDTFSVNSDGWCGFGESGPSTSNAMLRECQTPIPNLEQTTKLILIVQGNQAAAYINDQPILYLNGLLPPGIDITIGATVTEGTATVSIDDVEFWNFDR